MKDTHKLDTLRNIIKTKASHISIMLIASLGVAAFLSMDYAAFSLKSAGEYAYEKADFRDLELISPLMFTEEDIDAVRKTEGVDDTEPVFLTGALASEGNINRSVNVISLTERINKARVIKGRAPEEIFECAIEERLATELGISLGDSISIFSSEGSHHEYLREEKYILTGIMVHPNHMNPSSAEAPYVFVTSDAFDKEKLGGRIMAVELTTDEREKVKEKLGTLAKESFLSRLESISEAEFEELISAGMIPKDLIPEGMPFPEIKTILKGIIESKDQLWVINDEKRNTDYVSMLIDIENISSAMRTKSQFELEGLFIQGGTLSKEEIKNVFLKNKLELESSEKMFLKKYLKCAYDEKKTQAYLNFERMRNMVELDILKGYESEVESEIPFMLFCFKRLVEIKNLRLISSCIKNGLGENISKKLLWEG